MCLTHELFPYFMPMTFDLVLNRKIHIYRVVNI